jgi:hypothetical protein
MAQSYTKSVLSDGWQEFRRQVLVVHKVIPAVCSAPVAALYYWLLFQGGEQKEVSMQHIFGGFLCLVLAYATVLVLVFGWYIITAPARLHKKLATEAENTKGLVEGLQKEKDEQPKLRIQLITQVVHLSSKNQQWQALVEVWNTSKNKDIDNVELFIESVTPDSAIKYITFPSEVELAAVVGQRVKTYKVESLKPSHLVRFAAIVGTSNMVCLGARNPHGGVLDMMLFGKISIALKASGSMVEPENALLVLTGSGTAESMLGLTLEHG